MNSSVVCFILILFACASPCLCVELYASFATGSNPVNITQSNTTDIDWIIGTAYSNCSIYSLYNTLPSPGDTSEIITFSGWKPTFDNTSLVYRIDVTLSNQNENDNISFSLVRLMDSCGNIITSSNITNTTYYTPPSSYSTAITFFDLALTYSSLGGGFTLELQRRNPGIANFTYAASCIKVLLTYNVSNPSAPLAVCPSPSPTPSLTPSPTPTITPSSTPSVSMSPSIPPSASASPSVTSSPSITPSISTSSTSTPSITPSASVTPSISVTPQAGGGGNGKSNGATIGAVVGGVVGGLALCGIVAFVVVRRRRKQDDEDRSNVEMSRRANSESSSSYSGYAPFNGNNSISDIKPLTKKGTVRDELYIDDVKLKAMLGKGKFGEVYEGIWHGTTPVACKKLKKEDQSEFENEIRLLTMLNHPNVVRCLGIWLDSKTNETYMVLELLRLGSLTDFLRKKENQAKLSVADLIEMCINITSGMVYLEQKNIVHRDLGARNLLITESDGKYVVKVSDFGLSRQVEESDAVYSSKEGVFPIKWSPPEVINYRKFTSKSDVWSLGITMWEVFEFGKVPYPDMTNQQCMEEVMKGYRLSQPANCPNRVFAVMQACWHEDPDLRPNFKSVHEALRNILSDLSKKKDYDDESYDLDNNSARNSLYNTGPNQPRKSHAEEIYNSRVFEN